MQIALVKKPEMRYVDDNANLNVPAVIKPLPITPGSGLFGKCSERHIRAEQLLEKGFAVKELLYDTLLGQSQDFILRLLAAKPEATLQFLSRVLPQDNLERESSDKKMPVLIINNTANAAIKIEE